jgi:hypothetical protein
MPARAEAMHESTLSYIYSSSYNKKKWWRGRSQTHRRTKNYGRDKNQQFLTWYLLLAEGFIETFSICFHRKAVLHFGVSTGCLINCACTIHSCTKINGLWEVSTCQSLCKLKIVKEWIGWSDRACWRKLHILLSDRSLERLPKACES